MRATIMDGAGDVRVENVPGPSIALPTDAVLRGVRACVCGSDLSPYPARQEGPRRRDGIRASFEELLFDVVEGRIEPGQVFDCTVGLDGVPDACRAMQARESIEVMVTP